MKLQYFLAKEIKHNVLIPIKMLEFSSSRPLAIKGLILITNKNQADTELFSNMLSYSKNFKIPLEFLE